MSTEVDWKKGLKKKVDSPIWSSSIGSFICLFWTNSKLTFTVVTVVIRNNSSPLLKLQPVMQDTNLSVQTKYGQSNSFLNWPGISNWKWSAATRYYTSHTKTMLPKRKSVPRSSGQFSFAEKWRPQYNHWRKGSQLESTTSQQNWSKQVERM